MFNVPAIMSDQQHKKRQNVLKQLVKNNKISERVASCAVADKNRDHQHYGLSSSICSSFIQLSANVKSILFVFGLMF